MRPPATPGLALVALGLPGPVGLITLDTLARTPPAPRADAAPRPGPLARLIRRLSGARRT